MPKDLRTFIDEVHRALPGQLVHVDREVDPEWELTAVLRRLEGEGLFPAVQFSRVRGTAFPVLANALADRTRIALLFDVDRPRIAQAFAERCSHPIPAVRVCGGPVKEVVNVGEGADVTMLPQIVHSKGDAGPYFTAAVLIARDPRTGVYNAGVYRVQPAGPRKLRVNPARGSHLWRLYCAQEELGEPLEVALCVGHYPTLLLASQYGGAPGVDEIEVAGALAGEAVRMAPAETLDLDVPADGEIIVEGRILPRLRESEGPFVELAQFLNAGESNPVLEVTAVTHRADAIFQDVFSAHAEHNNVGAPAREARLLARAREVCDAVRAVSLPVSGAGRFVAYVAVDAPRAGLARNLALTLLGTEPILKLVVVTDADVDVCNEADVLWAVATRVQADRDVVVIPDAHVTAGDPTGHGVSNICERGELGAKWLVDATSQPGSPASVRWDLPRALWGDIRLSEYVAEFGHETTGSTR